MSGFLRGAVVAVVGIVGSVLLLVGGVSAWMTHQVDDTDRYVAAADRIWAQARVKQGLTDRAADSVMGLIRPNERIDAWVDSLVEHGMDPIVANLLLHTGGNFEDRLSPAVRQLLRAGVETEEFDRAWSLAARHTHEPLMDYLRGESDTIIGDDDGALVFRLDVALGEVSLPDQLGMLLPPIPVEGSTIEIASAETMGKAQDSYQSMSTAATWLPWAGLLLVVTAVVLARRRWLTAISLTSVVVGLGALVVVLDRAAPHVLLAFAVEYGRLLPL